MTSVTLSPLIPFFVGKGAVLIANALTLLNCNHTFSARFSHFSVLHMLMVIGTKQTLA